MPISPSDTIIFFDWDDTLLCSSYLSDNDLRLDSPDNDLDDYLDELKI